MCHMFGGFTELWLKKKKWMSFLSAMFVRNKNFAALQDAYRVWFSGYTGRQASNKH